KVWDTLNRAFAGGLHGAGGAMEQLVTEFGGSQGSAAQARRDVISLGEWAMIEGGMGRFSRPGVEPGGVASRPVGTLPTPQDFSNAAKVLTPNEKPIIPEGAGIPISLEGVTEQKPLRLQFMANRTGSGGRVQTGSGDTILPLTEATFEKYLVEHRRT